MRMGDTGGREDEIGVDKEVGGMVGATVNGGIGAVSAGGRAACTAPLNSLVYCC